MYIENDKIELKAIYKPEIKKEIVAFLNTNGGKIYIGISDEGSILGLENTKNVIESITQVIHESIKPDPSLICKAREIFKEGKTIVEVEIGEGVKKPYYIAEKGLKPAGVYARINNTSQQASNEIIRDMLLQAEKEPFELTVSVEQNLTFDYVSEMYKKQNIELKFKNFKLIDSNGMYTNLALLLSDQCPFSIKLASYEGNDKSAFLDRKEYDGSLFKQVEDTYAYLLLNNKTKGSYDGLLRIDKQDYDPLVLREALLNAVIHRDYSLNGSILISIFFDRIEYVSIGGLVYGMTYDDMMLGVSRSRNENLANVFFKVKYVEAYGTGVEKIQGSYINEFDKPVFKISDNGFSLTLPNRNANKSIEVQKEFLDESIVLNYIKQKRFITREMLENQFEIKKSKATSILKEMVDSDILEIVGKGPNTRYKVK